MSTQIECGRALALQLDELLAAPDSAECREFLAHAASCRRCARELLLLREVQGGLRRELAGAHPTDEALLAFHERAGMEPATRDGLRLHLAACDVCRTTLEAFAGMQPEPGGAPGSAPSLGGRLASWLGGLLALPRPALAAAVALSITAILLFVLPTETPDTGGPAPDLAELTQSPATPAIFDETQVAKAEDSPAAALPEPPAPEPLPATAPAERAGAEAPAALAGLPPPPAPDAQALAGGPPGPGEEVAESEPERDAELLVAALARSAPPVYVPPQRGAPSVRIGGGTRSAIHDLPRVLALAPEHEGLTVSESPTLYWFLSREASVPVEVVLTHPDRVGPVIELRIEPPVAAGFHSVRLDKHDIVLEPGTAYRWFVSLVPDETRRSSDVIAGGVVRRVVPDTQLEAQLAATDADRVGHLYAERGLWYDALAFWSQWIEEIPTEPRLRAQRAALLEQAGLTAAAAKERQ